MLAIYQIILILLDVVWWVIVAQFVLSILINFNVINTYNNGISSLWDALQRITDPLYAPIRKIIPPISGIDFSPAIILILMRILQQVILPNVFSSLLA